MQNKVIVPKMGMSTVEVDITQLYVKIGDHLQVGDPIAEVESEKANFTIESEFKGEVVELFFDEGATVDVGTVICTVKSE